MAGLNYKPLFDCSLVDRKRTVRALGALMIGAVSFAIGADAALAKAARDEAGQPQKQDRALTLPANPHFVFGVLGSFEFKTAKHRFLDDWTGTLKRIDGERGLYEACDRGLGSCPAKLKKWRNLIDDVRGLPQLEQIAKLNRSLNQLVRYVDDAKVFGARDYWATPVEFLRQNGDCEDYAILKFVSLLELGFSNEQLRITIVRDRRRRLMHAVLAVQIGDKTYILDNLFNDVVEQQYVLKYVPIFSVNLDNQWAHITTNKIRAAFVTQTMNGTVKTTMQQSVSSKTANNDEPVQKVGRRRDSALLAQGAAVARRELPAVVDWT